jgi:hypothetical protein
VIVYNITAISLIQSITPAHLLGRANASRRFLVWSPLPIGALVGGAIGSTIGLRETVFIAALGTTLATLWLTRRPLRRIGALADEPSVVSEAVPALP